MPGVAEHSPMPIGAAPSAVASGLSATHTPRFWKAAAQESPLAAFVSAAAPVGSHDVVTRGGDLFRVFRLQGLAFEGADPAAIEEQHRALAAFVRNLPPGRSAVYLHRIHRFEADRLHDVSAQDFAGALSRRYQARLDTQPLLRTDLYLTLLVRPEQRVRRSSAAPTSLVTHAAAVQRDRALKELQDLSSSAQRSLRGFGLRPLGIREEQGVAYWEAGEFLSLLINGRQRKVRLPEGPAWLSLPDARLGFGGDTLEIRHLNTRRYAKLLGLKRLQRHVEPGTLGALLYEPCEYIETQSWSSCPRRQAQAALALQRAQLTASEDAAHSEVAELDEALDLLASGELNMGEYAYTLAVFGDSVEEAANHAARCAAALIETTDLELASVDLVADAAWFSQQPGNFQWRPRKATISNRAFAAMACAHNFHYGRREGNPWQRPVALLRAYSGAPYYFSFQAGEEATDATGQRLPGNTLIVGATGSGKTTLLGTLLSLARLLPVAPRIVSFSLDRDTEILIRALGGTFHRIRYGEPTGLNPFAREATEANRGFWLRLVARCIHNPQLPLMPADEDALARAIEAVSMLEPGLRSMSTIRQNLPRSGANSLYDRLGRWCVAGDLGWVFDGAATQPDGGGPPCDPQVIGFDYTEVLDEPSARVPLLMVLLQTMEDMLDGRPLIYHVAEAWKALDDPVFAQFLRHNQKTIRKKNGLGIFDTQQVEDLLRSDNGRVMVEQSPTKLLLANPDATRQDYVEGLGLSPTEFDLLREMTSRSRRRFVVKQGEHFVPCELDLGGLEEELAVLGATPDNLRRMDEARRLAVQRAGDAAADDPSQWLPLYAQMVRAALDAGRRTATPERVRV